MHWPGSPDDLTVNDDERWVALLRAGVFLAIRNPVSHGTVKVAERDAMEQLASLRMLMRWVDQCELEKVTGQDVV